MQLLSARGLHQELGIIIDKQQVQLSSGNAAILQIRDIDHRLLPLPQQAPLLVVVVVVAAAA